VAVAEQQSVGTEETVVVEGMDDGGAGCLGGVANGW
jgi:hypothetical protein